MKEKKIIPDQRVGSQLDIGHEYKAVDQNEARKVFQMAVSRLLNPNVWDKICGPLSAKFTLTDQGGMKKPEGGVHPGDHFRIDLPGPGPSAGDGFDWVHVEALDDRRNPSGENESITVRVRPAPSPENADSDTAHFFKEHATSSFRVMRVGDLVRAEVHGRNEVPNTDVHKITDKVRNTVVGGTAVAGASKPQWKSLVRGLLDTSINDDGTKI